MRSLYVKRTGVLMNCQSLIIDKEKYFHNGWNNGDVISVKCSPFTVNGVLQKIYDSDNILVCMNVYTDNSMFPAVSINICDIRCAILDDKYYHGYRNPDEFINIFMTDGLYIILSRKNKS